MTTPAMSSRAICSGTMPSRNASRSLSVSSWACLPFCSGPGDAGWVWVSLLGARGFVFGFCADAEQNRRTMSTLKAHPRSSQEFRLVPISSELTFVLSLTKPPLATRKISGSILQADLHDPAAENDPYIEERRQNKAGTVDGHPNAPAAALPEPKTGITHCDSVDESDKKQHLQTTKPWVEPLAEQGEIRKSIDQNRSEGD